MKLLVSACLLGVLCRYDPFLPGDLWWAAHTPAGI